MKQQREFVDFVQEHRVITGETCDSLIVSVNDELAALDSSNTVKIIKLRNLRMRLVYMKRSSQAIEDFIFSDMVDEELLAQLIRNRWHGR